MESGMDAPMQMMETSEAPVKGIPANLEAERAVLGSLLIDPDAIIKIASFLRAEDFYRERHAWLYEAMMALHDRREPLDFVTVVDELERRGHLQEVGGPAYITDLISGTPSAMYVDHYARIVERTALLRRLISAAGQIAELAYDDSQEVDEVIDKAETLIFGVSEALIHRDLMPIRTIMTQVVDHIDFLARNQDTLMGVPTGFTFLDRLLGGLQKSDLIILAARPAMGKTSLALNIAQNAAKRYGARVGIFSLEMSNEQLVQRLLSMETGIDSHRLRLGQVHDEEWPILLEAANLLANTAIFIDDTPAATANEIRTKCRRLYAEHGLDLVLIDYMQLMSGQSGGREANRQQEISYISRSLKGLARELNVPVIALSQLSRAVESRSDKRPMLSDLRESGCLAGDTPIYLPEMGQYVPVRALVNEERATVASLDQNSWRLTSAPLARAFCTGVKPVFELRTQLGRSLRATANHRFLTIDGWKRLDELSVGDHIATPRTLMGPDSRTMNDAEIALLGHLIGDGCTLPRHAIQYTSRDHELAELVMNLAKQVFGDSVTPRIVQERRWFQVYLSATEHLTHQKRNPVAVWLDGLGVFGLRSWEKRVPNRVFAQSPAGIGVFLRHLWATDGCVQMVYGKSPRPAIFYATSSAQLAWGVQSLLLRLGINARIKQVAQGEKGRDQFHVIVGGHEDVKRFSVLVGAAGKQRVESLETILAWIENRIPNTNRDVIPASVWRSHVVPAMQQIKMTTRQMQAELEMQYCGTSLYASNLGRTRAAEVAEIVRSPELGKLANSDVYWDRIAAITPAGEEPVYDLTVPPHHNFVAGNLIVHNSIEQDADVVMFIYREDYYIEDTDRQNIADVIVAKHRHGSTGTISLYFRKELTQFRDLEVQRTELDY
ncbi:MAG: replicative DNA helicase [Caldilinea sp.]|jgi:replicative DNA helicase|nr:replicative DNA helicase [Caldilinea sp.]